MQARQVVVGTLMCGAICNAATALATELVEDPESGRTQAPHARNAALALQDLGLQTSLVILPLEYCTESGQEMQCSEAGTWEFEIEEALEAEAAVELYDWVVTERLDRIILSRNQARFATPQAQITVDVPTLGAFAFGEGAYSDFKVAAEKWLNTDVAAVLGKITTAARTQRYGELPEQARATFIDMKAKEMEIPAEFLDKFINSAYAFSVYLHSPTGSATISRGTKTVYEDGRAVQVPIYDASVSLKAAATTLVHEFSVSDRKFVYYDELRGSTGLEVSTSHTFDSRPSQEDAVLLFRESFLVAMRAIGVATNTKLKQNDNFAVFFAADAVTGRILRGDVGVAEDIRVDAPATLYRVIDGETVATGFVKARQVSHNCTDRLPSSFQVIRGNPQTGDQLRESPWTGLLLATDLAVNNYRLDKWAGQDAGGGGLFTGVSVRAALDLGYSLNTPLLSEIWFEVGGGLGLGGAGFDQLGDASPMLIRVDLGTSKRYYFGTDGLYVSPGIDFGIVSMWATDSATDIEHSVSSYLLTPSVRLGYSISPNLEFGIKGGWGIGLGTTGSRKVGDATASDVVAEAAAGMRVELGVSFHLPVVGPMARLYAKPSSICRRQQEALSQSEQVRAAFEAQLRQTRER